jgi:glycosyltransferase involved in cell wall biosynthesis
LKYGFAVDDKVMFTLTRMDPTERYKGYDRVIDAMAETQNECPKLKYLLGGSFVEEEKKYIDEKIENLGLTGKVVFAGFISDEKLAEYFTLSDFYVMPSYNEGFGIVFIEALFYGLPVVGGNIDGTIDALDHGNFGILINPMDIGEISKSIVTLYQDEMNLKVDKLNVMAKFGYDAYKLKTKEIFFN